MNPQEHKDISLKIMIARLGYWFEKRHLYISKRDFPSTFQTLSDLWALLPKGVSKIQFSKKSGLMMYQRFNCLNFQFHIYKKERPVFVLISCHRRLFDSPKKFGTLTPKYGRKNPCETTHNGSVLSNAGSYIFPQNQDWRV